MVSDPRFSAQTLGFGAAGVVIFSKSGDAGLGGFLLILAGSLAITTVFLALAALISAGSVGLHRTRALAVALLV